MRDFARALPVYVLLATAVGFVDWRTRTHNDVALTSYVPAVVHGTEPPPAKYRVLAPFAVAGVARILPVDPQISWVIGRWGLLFVTWIALHVLITTWFEAGVAVAGNTLLAALLPLTFTNTWPPPDQFFELALSAAACAAIARRRRWALAVILVLAALNRETSAFLVLLFGLSAHWCKRHVLWTGALAGLWALVYVGLRLVLGFVPYSAWNLRQNLVFMGLSRHGLLRSGFDPYTRIYAWLFVLLLLGMAVPIVRTWGRQPRMVRAAVGVVTPVFVVVAMLWSSVIETRIFTLLLPMLVPGLMFAWFSPTDQSVV
jgi:hypothetical protein